MRAFFTKMTNWHRYLAWPGERPPTGKADHRRVQPGVPVPRAQRLVSLVAEDVDVARRSATSSGSAGPAAQARDFNWHNTIGFWCVAPVRCRPFGNGDLLPMVERSGLSRRGRGATAHGGRASPCRPSLSRRAHCRCRRPAAAGTAAGSGVANSQFPDSRRQRPNEQPSRSTRAPAESLRSARRW